MKISKDDFEPILKHLVEKRWEGEEYVAFCDSNLPVDKQEIYTFSTSEAAAEFCYEMTTDIDMFNYIAIRSAYRVMTEALKDSDLLVQKNNVVDIGEMVAQYYRRLEESETDSNQKVKAMNMKNVGYLQDQVKLTGFGELLKDDIKAAIEKGGTDFKLKHDTKYAKDNVSSELRFSKSKQSDLYFFNSYKVALEKEGSSEKLEQTFYINKGKNITLKEAYNLMNGRSVNKDLTNKEGNVYNAWVQLDFKQTDNNRNFKLRYYGENYGYNLQEALSKLPIKELKNDDYKTNLLESLKKGNLQSVTLEKDGQEIKQFVEACPQFKTIKVYDGEMQRIDMKKAKDQTQTETQAKSSKKSAKANAEETPAEAPKKQTRKTQRQST